MHITEIHSIRQIDERFSNIDISCDIGYGETRINFSYDPADAGELTTLITTWLTENPEFEILPIIEKTLDELKTIKIEAVKEMGDIILKSGFPFETEDFGVQHLQLRDDTDRTNWLTSQAAYQAQVILGNPDVVGAIFRTAENNTIQMTYQNGWILLLQMAGWGSHLFQVSWDKQDTIRAVTTEEELDLISVEDGWIPTP